MAFQKVGLNISALQNLTPPSSADFGINTTHPATIIDQIPAKANIVTRNFLGLGIMIALFFYLVWKLGDMLDLTSQPYSGIRTIGIAAGVVALMGYQMLMIGYFTVFYHVVIFLGLALVSFIWVFIEDR